ncbi:MAG: ribosomal L7Ae/L30e/S12e/Gadd45 family protein [Oscillospiraceae bacterium]|jgi:ribosomal protein L7Ae-like RNA K-turn-binding protein|nr:ribosomal L7Ae/L30e/S12e/Gadd45 family protein [Oscillospiraceae bacterium]
MDKTLNLLGLAKKAGLLAIGSEAASILARQGKAHLIITATDASDGTIRRAKANAESSGSRYLAVPYSKFDLGNIIGRGSPGVIAFSDKGLADVFFDKVTEQVRINTRKESDA